MKTLEGTKKSMKSKRISVSEKRQITIPKEYYDALSIGNEIECTMGENCIIIKPISENSLDEFSEYILQDIIKEGYKGEQILKEFKQRRRKMKEATKKFIEDIDDEAKNIDELSTFEEVFEKGDET